MPQIGDIYVPDDYRAPTGVAPAGRPGLGAILGGAVQQAYGQVRYGVPYALEKAFETASPNDDAFYKEGLRRTSVAANAAAPASVSDLTSGNVGFGRFVAENLAGSLPQTATSIAGGVLGARFGGVKGALAGASGVVAPQFVGSNVDRAVQETGTLTRDAAARSLFTAPFQAVSDALVERYLPGAGHILGDFAAHQTGNFIARTAKSIVKAGATEAVAEAGQQLGERVSAGLPVTGPQAAAEYVNAAVTAFAIGGVLGAGGGIRRFDAHNKAATDVTTDDLTAAVDGALAPKPALTPVENPSYPAPIPGQSTTLPQLTDQRVVNVGADGTATTAEQRQPAPLDLGPQDPAVLAQNAADRLEAARQLATGAEAPGAQADAARAQIADALAGRDSSIPPALRAPTPAFDPQAAVDAIAPATSARALDADGAFNGTANLPDVTPPRMFADEPITDLHAALTAKNASPEVKAEATKEVATRMAEATGAAPLTTDKFQTRVDEVKAGLRNQFVQKLTATDPADLMNKVYDRVLVDQDTSSGTVKLAQRLGLLDENLEPTAAANAIEAQRTAQAQQDANTPTPTPVGTAATSTAPAAPVSIAPQTVDPDYAAQFEQLKKAAGIDPARTSAGLKAAGLDVAPANAADAQAKVFSALATDSTNAATSQVEKLAQHMGLITNDDARDVTPKGRQVYLATPAGRADIEAAKAQQGYTGTQGTAFDQGVVAATNENAAPPSFTNFEDLAAHEAGKVFAQDFVQRSGVTAAQTNAISYRKGEGRAQGSTPATGPVEVREQARTALTPTQVNQRALNNLIDAADLSTTPDTDVAALRRMVRDGASPDEVGKALQQVQGGTTLFKQAPTAPAVLPALPTRGQPIFKEMNTAETPAAARASQRAETKEATRVYDQRNVIRQALVDKEIPVARANKLNDLLDEGKVAQVERLTKDFGTIRRDENGRAGFGGGTLGFSDVHLEQALAGKSFTEAAEYLVKNAPSAATREIMSRVLAQAKRIEAASGGHGFELKIIQPGDRVPRVVADHEVQGYTEITHVPPVATVYLKSQRVSPETGVNYQIAAHEMIHAATMVVLQSAREGDPNGNTKLGKAAKDLRDLATAVKRHINDRLDNGDRLTHTEFELQHALGEHNAFEDEHELLSWGLTNPEMQRYLQGIAYKPRESVFSRFVGLIRDLLGIPAGAKYDTALTELLRVSEQVLGLDARDLTPVFGRTDPAFGENVVAQAAGRAAVSAPDSNTAAQHVVSAIVETASKIDATNLQGKARRATLYAMTQNQMDRQFGQRVPGRIALSDSKRFHDAVRGRVASIGEQAHQRFEALRKASKDNADRVQKLMAEVAEFRIDPEKSWEAHAHLLDDDNVADLRGVYDRVQKLRNDLRRGDGEGYKVFQDFRTVNEMLNYSQLAMELHTLVSQDAELTHGVPNAQVNPAKTFMQQADLSTAETVRDHWRSALDGQVQAALNFVKAKTGEAASGTEGDIRGMKQHLQPIQEKIATTYKALEGMTRAPYFHLGRFGDNFASGTIRRNTDGTIDRAAQKHVAQVFADAGFTGIQLSTDNTRPKFATRLETDAQTNQFRAILETLAKQGWIENNHQTGPRDPQNYGVAAPPDYLNRQIQAVQTDPRYQPETGMTDVEKRELEARKQETIQILRDTWLEQQPDSGLSKVLTARYTTPGYSTDMVRSWAHRVTVGATSLANKASARDASDAYKAMRAQLDEARRAESKDDAYVVRDILVESLKRDAMNPINPTAGSFGQMMDSATHAYYLGLSPAFGAIQLMQVGTNGLPELAKNHGYGKSFHALRRATPAAFAVLRAAAAEAAKGGAAHYADVALTENALQRAGLTKSQTDFMRRMIATGSLDIGQSANAISQIASGAHGSKFARGFEVSMKYATAIGLHTETFSRLVVALAAHDLHGGEDTAEKAAYAQNVVSNSMFDYQTWNTSRALGKQGFLGPITPMVTRFMSYSLQMTEKLYSEAASAMGKARPGESEAATAERARASRVFLVGHLTAITALAGTLGLPFASVFATAIERLVNSVGGDDEPYDATASWRNFLASVLGKDVAEVISRGAPRALGFDISTRVGESDLLPFSQLLGDRRSWRESIQSTLGRSAGAGPDMFINLADAGTAFGNGDVLGGMKAMLPIGFKGPTEAYRMSTEGYVDSKGNKLPMTPGASAILYQLLGFTPAEKAEYSEARGDQQSRRVGLNATAGALRSRIVKALTSGDAQGAQDLIAKAQEFDTANPGFAVIPSLRGAVQRQAQSQARARALKTPLGVGLKDPAGQGLTGYANINYQ